MQRLVGGPARACNVFLVCDDRKKTWKFLRCIHVFDLVLKFGSDTNGRNWLQLLLHFFVMMGKNATVIRTSFLCFVSGFRLKFSRIALWRKRLPLDSKSDLTMNGLILELFVRKWLPSLTSYHYELESARIAQLLFFWWHQILSMFTSRCNLLCSLKMLVPFNQRIFKFRLVRFSEAMQRYFPYFRLFHFLCFLGSFGKILWLLLKTIESILQFLY